MATNAHRSKQENAQLSTGPTSETDKAKSSLNASKQDSPAALFCCPVTTPPSTKLTSLNS